MTVNQESQPGGRDPNRSGERSNRGNGSSERRRETMEYHQARQQIENYKANKDQMSEQQKEQVRNTVTQNIKSDVQAKSRDAEMASKTIEISGGQVSRDIAPVAESIEDSVRLFRTAAQEGLINKPQDPTSAAFFDKLILKLTPGFDSKDASYIQPIIDGLLSKPNYIRFSREGEPKTSFEEDLNKIVGTGRVSTLAETVVTEAVNELRNEGMITNLTQEQFDAKKTEAKHARTTELDAQREDIRQAMDEIQGSSDFTRNEDKYLANLIEQGGSDDPDVKLASKLLRHMESPERFRDFYREIYDQKLREDAKVLAITDPEKRKERASKETTHEINKTLIYMVHKIFAPVIDGGSKKPFAQLVQDASTGYMLNPQTVFYNLKKKIMYLAHPISERDTKWEEDGIKYYQYRNTKKKTWVPRDGDHGKAVVLGKFVEETESMELRESSYKEFLENMYLSIDAEKDLLETGINFNYLMSTGQTQEQQSFFQQAAQYAKQTLPANRLDELYKLPFADLVEAAKIQLSSYYKKKMAMNHWRKDPEVLLGLFENMNEVESEALKDMIHNFGDMPEWVIKRAIIHARMHLSLVNLEIHALSSYAHATVNDLASPTYRDQSLKNLEVFRTWYNAEMWQVSDTFVKGMAFMPQPDRNWYIENWVHEDITAEGRDIYDQSFLLGKMAVVDRKNYNEEMLPNIMELNPMGNGGVEIQLGWRMKYAMYPWLQDMLDPLNNENQFDLSRDADPDNRAFEYGWKRIENISANMLKIYRDEFLWGQDDAYIKEVEGGGVKQEKRYEHFFKFLYRRYFKDGLGKEGFYADVNSDQEFWEQVVRPILHKKTKAGKGESAKSAEGRNRSGKIDELKGIINNALTIVAFERVPMDFVFMESTTRSQNGVTLLQELQDHFHKTEGTTVQELDTAFDDILFVQQKARTTSIEQMNDHLRQQTDNNDPVKTLYGENIESLKQDRSDIEIVEGQAKKGYAVDVDVIKKVLEQKYQRIPNMSDEEKQKKIKRALDVYIQIKTRMTQKPEDNPHALKPDLTGTRLKMKMKQNGVTKATDSIKEQYINDLRAKFAKYRDESITNRINWSKGEIIGAQSGMPINDTAYQYLELVRGGRDMVQRSISAIASMQERYKNDVNGGGLLSALKKYYRKEDLEALHELITDMRTSIKDEDEGAANQMAMRVLENAMNVMRINTEAESLAKEAEYMVNHKLRSAFSTVVKEGPEYPLHREDRYRIVTDFLHYAQFPKHTPESAQVFEVAGTSHHERWKEYGWIGSMAGSVADTLFGKGDGDIVRKKWKEMSGEGLRNREIANVAHMLLREGPKYIGLVLLAVLILSMKRGLEENES